MAARETEDRLRHSVVSLVGDDRAVQERHTPSGVQELDVLVVCVEPRHVVVHLVYHDFVPDLQPPGDGRQAQEHCQNQN